MAPIYHSQGFSSLCSFPLSTSFAPGILQLHKNELIVFQKTWMQNVMHLQTFKFNKVTSECLDSGIWNQITQLLTLANQFWNKKRPEIPCTKPLSHWLLQLSALQWQLVDWVLSRLLNRHWFFYLCCLPTFLFHSPETISEQPLPSHVHVYIPHPTRCVIPHPLPDTFQVKNYYHT